MAASIKDGPSYDTGNLTQLTAAMATPGGPVPDPNQDAGPNVLYQAQGFFDVRIWVPKDKLQGYTGNAQAHMMLPHVKSIGQIPAALAANNIAAAQNVSSGVAMTLAAASVGVTLNVPIIPFSSVMNSSAAIVATAAIALDFGYAFGSTTAGSATITVSDSTLFYPGQNIVIGGVGNSGGTTCLLTQVATLASATTITVISSAVPQATNATAPIGSGNMQGPSEVGFRLPVAAQPFLAGGPANFLDPRQAITRGVQITGAGGSSGGTFTVAGWDIYGQPMTETITVGAASTGWGKKAFKYISSVTPNFSDAANYTVGTSDVFGFAYRSRAVEDTRVWWAAALMVSGTGWLTADTTSPATATTGDVRGTIQTSTNGGGSGIGASASNGTVVSLAMSGRRLEMAQWLSVAPVLMGTSAAPRTIYGVTQA